MCEETSTFEVIHQITWKWQVKETWNLIILVWNWFSCIDRKCCRLNKWYCISNYYLVMITDRNAYFILCKKLVIYNPEIFANYGDNSILLLLWNLKALFMLWKLLPSVKISITKRKANIKTLCAQFICHTNDFRRY